MNTGSITTEDHQHRYVSSALTSNRRGSEVTWEWKRFHQTGNDTFTTFTSTDSSGSDFTYRELNDDDNTTENRSRNSTSRIRTPSRNNLLIGQYDSGSDALYETLLNLTSTINIAYAKKFSFDYVTLRGMAYQTIFDSFRIPKPSRATYSKVLLIQTAMKLNYDYLLILDSDAMMYDFDRDVSLLIPEDKMVMAHLVHDFDKKQYYNINVGVILFNLHHPMLRHIVRVWNLACYVQILLGVSDNDQNPIQRILQLAGARPLVEGNRHEFAYNNGTFIKHFKRINSKSWTDGNMDNRIADIQSMVQEVCSKYSSVC